MNKIQDEQKYWKADFQFDKEIPLFRECKKCGKFSRPSRRKRISYGDTHCRNCGEEFNA